MSFQITAAKSSRVTKSKSKNPLAGRSSASPFQRRRAASSKQARKPAKDSDDDDDELFTERLEDHGLITSLLTDLRFRDVAQQLQYIQDHMFDAIPERAGMNSTRIAEVLNFRKSLPPIVSVAHVHALSVSPTTTDREIAELVRGGIIRKMTIPGRGLGSSAIGESLALTERYVTYVEESQLEASVKQKYIAALQQFSSSSSVPVLHFTPAEASALTSAGFLTSGTSSARSNTTYNPATASSVSLAGSRAAAGSVAAVGGASAIYDAGGGGSALSVAQRSPPDYGPRLNFALPSTGSYLRLLESARSHLVNLLAKSKFKEAPKDILRERWDGGIAKTERNERGKGLQGAVLPGRTRKWKQYYGLKFDWILEECLGSGLIELFDTGSVGHGVRLTA